MKEYLIPFQHGPGENGDDHRKSAKVKVEASSKEGVRKILNLRIFKTQLWPMCGECDEPLHVETTDGGIVIEEVVAAEGVI